MMISKEISTLENDMLELKESLSEWKSMPSLLHIDDSASALGEHLYVRILGFLIIPLKIADAHNVRLSQTSACSMQIKCKRFIHKSRDRLNLFLPRLGDTSLRKWKEYTV